jgi:hypothetical protein
MEKEGEAKKKHFLYIFHGVMVSTLYSKSRKDVISLSLSKPHMKRASILR